MSKLDSYNCGLPTHTILSLPSHSFQDKSPAAPSVTSSHHTYVAQICDYLSSPCHLVGIPAEVREEATISEATVITAKKVIHTLLDHAPYLSDFTTTFAFTQEPPSETASA
ncbi:hypothetical protein DL96DRAFT_1714693 [Flagelloscypha sp. PMI_526]|nr:hypothetical protein DL96DRAFT_1714693 [Flagelloscypha sp. PMI_526]